MNQESTSNINENNAPGALLKAAKEQANLSSEQVATRLNLTTDLIESIEADDYRDSISPAFYRGYLRSYGQLVGIDADQLIELYNEIIHQDSLSASITPTFDTNLYTKKEHDYSYFKWIIYFVVAVLIGYAGYFIWDKKIRTGANPTNQISLSPDENDNPSEISLSGLEQDDSEQQQDSEPQLEHAIESQSLPIANDEIQNTDNPTQTSSSNKSAILQMDFQGDCWVKVVDATGEVLAIGIKRTGKSMSLDGIAPFSVILGNAGVVSMSYNQQTLDLSGYPAGNRVELQVDADSKLLQ